MASLLSGKSMSKDSSEILFGNSNTIVNDRNLKVAIFIHSNSQGQLLDWRVPFIQGVFGVTDEVDQDLKDFVFVDRDLRNLTKLADDLYPMASEGFGIHTQSIIHQLHSRDGFHNAGHTGVGLLHGDNIFDVFDIL